MGDPNGNDGLDEVREEIAEADVEKVARAMWNAALDHIIYKPGDPWRECHWIDAPELTREDYRVMARAALSTRQPNAEADVERVAHIKALEKERDEAKESHKAIFGELELIREAFAGWPALPRPLILNRLSTYGKWPEDWEVGCLMQREISAALGPPSYSWDVIPPKTECELGAGFWNRITAGAWREKFEPPLTRAMNTGEK